MIKTNYIRSSKITPKIKQTVIYDEHIILEGDRYEKLTRKPYGRIVVKNLIKQDKSEKITCYA